MNKKKRMGGMGEKGMKSERKINSDCKIVVGKVSPLSISDSQLACVLGKAKEK